jgi:ligand-binding sensor domain-containing protein
MKQYFIYGLILLFSSLAFGQDFWEANDGPYGGTIYEMITAPNGDVYAGGIGSVFRIAPGSDVWDHLGPGLPSSPVDAIAVNSSGHIFVGTAVFGVYRSTDDGASWQEINNGLSDLFINDIAINSAGELFIANFSGVFHSANNGDSWTQLSNGLPFASYTVLAVNANDEIFTGAAGSGMFRSTDNGSNWSAINNGLTNFFITSIAIDESNGDIALGTGGSGVFHSSDNGDNWSQIFTGTTINSDNPNIWIDVVVIAFGVLYLWGDTGGFYSQDLINFIAMINPYPTGYYIFAMAMNTLNRLFVGGEQYGIYASLNNGLAWTILSTGLAAYFVASMTLRHGIFAVTSNSGVFLRRPAATWILMGITALYYDYISRFIPLIRITEGGIESQQADTLYFASTLGAGFFRSSDGGNSWDQLQGLLFASFVSDFVVNDSGHIYAATESGVQFSSDYGDTWELRNNGLTTLFVSKIALAPDGTLWIGIGPSAYKSTDNGQNWVFSSIGISGTRLSSFAFGDPGEVYASSDGGAFYSPDNGDNWTSISNGLGNTEVEALAIKNSTEQTAELRAGTRGGIFRSLDKGNSWEDISSGLNSLIVYSLAFDESGNGYAGTAAGVFREAQATGTNPSNDITPVSYSLEQNYPNPFNPTTNIRFSLERPSRVLLTVFNSLGQKVATVVNEQLTSGEHQVTFDASQLAGGTYFYQIRTAEYKQTRKMLLVK